LPLPPKPPGIDEKDFSYDVYISYVDEDPDSTWVWDTLLPRLEQAGLRIAVSGEVGIPGVARLINIEDGITQSKRTIIVLSETYLADNMAEFENALVQTMGIEESSVRIVPIKFMPIDSNPLPSLPRRIGQLEIINLAHPRRPQAQFNRLVEDLQKPFYMREKK
jgi:hypothetical protein